MNITTKDASAVAQDVADRVVQADKNRPAALTVAIDQADAAAEALRLERIRLAFNYGEADPRVAEADARLQKVADDRRAAAADAQRSSVDAPRATPAIAALHGRVIDASQLGVQGLTVRVRRAEDGAEIGKTGTNEIGYFSAALHADKAEAATLDVMVEVLSANCRVAYRDSAPRTLQVGDVTYVEIEMMADKGQERPAGTGDKPPSPARGPSAPPLPATRKSRRPRQ